MRSIQLYTDEKLCVQLVNLRAYFGNTDAAMFLYQDWTVESSSSYCWLQLNTKKEIEHYERVETIWFNLVT